MGDAADDAAYYAEMQEWAWKALQEWAWKAHESGHKFLGPWDGDCPWCEEEAEREADLNYD